MNTTIKVDQKTYSGNYLEEDLEQEEHLVAELELLGIRYLSRLTGYRARRVRQPVHLLADLIRQPNSRVRLAFISLLLSNPEYSLYIHETLKNLPHDEQGKLKYYYTAAVFLQKKYAHKLQPYLAQRWLWFPDWFSVELGIPGQLSMDEQLQALGRHQQQQTGILLNWAGTYENAAMHLIRRWELEQKWNQ